MFTCRDYCRAAGYKYFGMECPMGTKVRCECSNTLTGSKVVDDLRCRTFGVGAHCIGPFNVFTKFGTFFMGAGRLNSAYAVQPDF